MNRDYTDDDLRSSDKDPLRDHIREERKKQSAEDILIKSSLICEKIKGLDIYKEAEYISAYAALPGEVVLDDLILDSLKKNKRTALPKVEGEDIVFYYISSLDEISPGYMDIREPKEGSRTADTADLLIVPGLAFDLEFHRLGHGKGFYDRFLAGNKPSFIIAPAFEYQILDEVFVEDNDVNVDMIVTEERIITGTHHG